MSERFSSNAISRLATLIVILLASVFLWFGALVHAQSTATTTSVVATPGAPRFGEVVTLVASVSPATAVGSVSFIAEGTVVGMGEVIAGKAQTRTVTLPPGLHAIRAVYGGGGGHAPSASAPLSYFVKAESGAGFAAPLSLHSTDSPYSVAVGDFNADGSADVAYVNVSHGTVTVNGGYANGLFSWGITLDAGSNPFAIVAGEFNGDGETDLAVANISSNSVNVLLGAASPKLFKAPIASAAGPTPYALAVGDFNVDGRTDLVVANSTANTVSVLLGNGDGTFQAPVASSVSLDPVAVAVGDFNHDGVTDVAAANYATRNVSVLLSNGDGTLRPAVHYATGSADYASPFSVAVGDFNRDGHADLVVANYKTANVSVLLGNGDGTFKASAEYGAGLGPRSLAVSDFNGDGIEDIGVANTSSTPGNETPATYLSLVSVLLGNGDGTFRPPIQYSAGSGPISIAVGDFNRDGRADLVTADVGSVDVSVLLATAPPSTSVTLFSAPNPSMYGRAVTLTADATPSTATGQVEFLDGTTVVGAATLDASGRAEIDTIVLASGTRALRAIYTGVAGVWQSSESPVLDQVVNPVAASSFAPAANYGAEADPTSVALGDFNGDGASDMALTNFTSYSVSVLLGSGNGTFQPAVNYSAGPTPTWVGVGDFNADRKPDLAVTGYTNVTVLMGNGDGTFQSAVNYAAGINPTAGAIGDFNSDGKADLAVADRDSGHVHVLLGDGDGTFQTAVTYVAGTARGFVSLAIGDFNADGRADLAVTHEASNDVSVLLGRGNGTFAPAAKYTGASGPTSAVTDDFNADGHTDLAIGNSWGDAVSVFLGNGDGTFQTAVNYTAGNAPWQLALGDFNGDGKPDVAAANGSGAVSILLGATGHNGRWAFRAPVSYPLSLGTGRLAVGDFNADGMADVAVPIAHHNGVVSILLGTRVSTTSVSLLSAPNPSRYGQTVTLTATMSPSNARGQVQFLDGATVLGYGTINGSGRAQMTTDLLPSGTRALRARYTGVAGSWLPSESAVVTHVVNAAISTGFAAPVNYTAGTEPYSVAVGDFNKDGRTDLAVANVSSHDVSVLLGNANGTFQAALNYPAGSHPFAIAVGDFNGDGRSDLAVANIGSGVVTVLAGNGNGTFQAPLPSAAGTTPYALAVGDFNVDGKADLVVANSSGNAVSVLLGHGTGTFQAPQSYGVGVEPVAVAVGDFNRDGVSDVVAANYITRTVSVLLGKGDGALQSALHYTVGSADYAAPYSLAVADFNGDGSADLAVANYKTANISVLRGNGDGTFQAAEQYAAGLGPRSLAVADFNGDGIADVTVANTTSTPGNETPSTYLSVVGVLLGNGDGTFRPPIQYGTGRGPISIAVGDFNGDARTDVATANVGSNDVTVLLATRLRGRLP